MQLSALTYKLNDMGTTSVWLSLMILCRSTIRENDVSQTF